MPALFNRIPQYTWVLLCFLFWGGHASAAIRNNNHVYALTLQCEQTLESVAQTLGKTLPDPEPPIFQNRLPIHLYFKTLDFHNQVRKLQQARNVSPIGARQLPRGTVRPRHVYALLDEACEGLKSLLTAKTDAPPADPVLGKTTNDNYARLWRLTQRMAALVPPPQPVDVLQELVRAESAIDQLARSQSLQETAIAIAQTDSPASLRTQLLIGFQVLHLTGRLQRQLDVEPIRPGSVKTGKVTLQDIYDTARILNADLYRTLQALNQPPPLSAKPSGQASADDLGGRWAHLRDRLLQLTGSDPV